MKKYFLIHNLQCRKCARDFTSSLTALSDISSATIDMDSCVLMVEHLESCTCDLFHKITQVIKKLDLDLGISPLPDHLKSRLNIKGIVQLVPGSRQAATHHQQNHGIVYNANTITSHQRDTILSDHGGCSGKEICYHTPKLTCPNCSSHILEELNDLNWVKSATYSLFTRQISITLSGDLPHDHLSQVQIIVHRHEPDVAVFYTTVEDLVQIPAGSTLIYLMPKLTCPNCSAHIVEELNNLDWIKSASYNLFTREMSISLSEALPCDHLSQIQQIVHNHEPDVEVIYQQSPSATILQSNAQSKETEHPEGAGSLLQLKYRIIGSVIVFVLAMILLHSAAAPVMLCNIIFLIAYVLVGIDVYILALKRIKGSLCSEQFLMVIASLGAIALGEYPEACAVMVLYQIGEYFQNQAIDKSRRSIQALLDLCPDTANLVTQEGLQEIPVSRIRVGDILSVRPGERIPCDGTVTRGQSFIDTSSITGESLPSSVAPGDSIFAGCIVQNGLIEFQSTKITAESTAARILKMVESSGARKARSENFITTFARYYTPTVVILSIVLTLIPTVFFDGVFTDWIQRSLIFLVVSCPCALVISIPLTYFSSIGIASRQGILVKGSSYLDALSKVKCIYFDKTGTLTKGNFKIRDIITTQFASRRQLLQILADCEQSSTHPLALALLQGAKAEGISPQQITKVEEIAGQGLKAKCQGATYLVGNRKLMAKFKVDLPPRDGSDTTEIFVAEPQRLLGIITIADEIKEDSAEAIASLKKLKIKTVMLTGDKKAAAQTVGRGLGLDEVHYELLPQDKVQIIEEEKKRHHEAFAVVGDGINDAPALALADVGFAMGGIGSDAANEAADIVIMGDSPAKIPQALQLSRQTRIIVWENIIFAIGVKIVLLILGALGMIGMWLAIFGDVGVMIIAVINALRMLILRKKTN